MAAENALKSKEVSAMIKQGFISDQSLSFSPSRSISKLHSPNSSPSSKTLSSPPPPPFAAASTQQLTRPTQSQSLYEMMSDEQHRDSKLSDRRVHEKVHKLLENAPFRNPNWGGLVSGDVRLTVVAKDGFRVSMDVHKSVLGSKSRFFAEKLRKDRGVSHCVEISDCDDVEVYVETVVLMYCENLKKRLMGEEVSRVLGLLKICALHYAFCFWINSFLYISLSYAMSFGLLGKFG